MQKMLVIDGKSENCTFNILYDCIIMILLGQIREIGLNVIIIAEEKNKKHMKRKAFSLNKNIEIGFVLVSIIIELIHLDMILIIFFF